MTMRGSSRRLVLAAALAFLPIAMLLVPGCSEEDTAIVEPADVSPPAAIGLKIRAVTDSSVTFTWQAPGDDYMLGVAQRYEVRYATFPLNEETFAQGTLVPGLLPPDPPRTPQQLAISGLTSGQTYYFALRSADEVPNWSPLSGVIDLTLPVAGEPMIWGGSQVPQSGTTLSAFLYEVRLRLNTGQSGAGVMEVLVAGTVHPMHLARIESNIRLYRFAANLPVGTYDYRFRFTSSSGQVSYLPNPGNWSGPTVEDVRTFVTDFVEVPVDTFRMGNPVPDCAREERPAHLVILTHPFAVDRFEVTNAQYCQALNWAMARGMVAVVGDTLALSRASGVSLLVTAPRVAQTSFGIRYTPETGFTPLPFREDWPVTDVTWYGAAFYCNVRSSQDRLDGTYNEANAWACGPAGQPYAAVGWRLPTEAEWEYVARYNDDRLYPTGNEPPIEGVEANVGRRSHGPSPVGTFPDGANPLGIMDLSGNVWEWCNDWLDYYRLTTDPSGTEIPQTNPTGPRGATTYRVARGGSWGTSAPDLRCVRRFGFRPESNLNGAGFRCVRRIAD